MLVQNTVRTEQDQSAKKPIYLVGESLGASLALVVAAQNPNIDFFLILANPGKELNVKIHQERHVFKIFRQIGYAHVTVLFCITTAATNISKSLVQSFLPLSNMICNQLNAGLLQWMSSIPGFPAYY